LTEQPLLVAGRVGKPHGLDGFFYVVDATEGLLLPGRAVHVGDEPTEVLDRKGTAARPILRVGLAATREDVAALRGRELRVGREQAPPLGDDEFWAEDLVGCTVVAGARELGEVRRLVGYPSCEVLEVGDLLVPMVRDAIRSVDLEARRIEVDAAFLGLGQDAE
jgi:16S rRNA processing protein RimM